MDPIQRINPKKDTTLAIMRTARDMSMQLYYIEPQWLSIENGKVRVQCRGVEVFDDDKQFYRLADFTINPALDAVLVRQDPPFSLNYIYTSYILQHLADSGVKVFNGPRALREFNEKVVISQFPQWTPQTLISSNIEQLRTFVNQFEYSILKPLDGMGGMGVFRLCRNDVNFESTAELLTDNFSTPIMAQQFIEQVSDGDKRIFIVNGKVVDYCLARIPLEGSVRANLAAGGVGVVRTLTERDYQIAQSVSQYLHPREVLFAGLDVIGDYLTEVNITSPTGVVEIAKSTGCNVAKLLLEAIDEKIV